MIKCKLCKQERKEYRVGFCQTCYRNFVSVKYAIKDENKMPKTKEHKEIVDTLLNDYNADRKQLAEKLNCSSANVTYVVKRYLKKEYVTKI